MRNGLTAIAACLMLSLTPIAALAENGAGCSEFVWPLATEMSWFKAETGEKTASGTELASLPQDKAIHLALVPMAQATLPAKPTSTPKADDDKKFAGFVTIQSFPEAGQYQVAISDSGWLDVVQNGTALESTSHTGSPNCDVLRKSVRFEIGTGPVTIQVSGVPKDNIKIAVRPAAD